MKVDRGIFCGDRLFDKDANQAFDEYRDEGFDYAEVSVNSKGVTEGVVYMAGVSAHFYVKFDSLEEAMTLLAKVAVPPLELTP